MRSSCATGTLGVVVVHGPDQPAFELPAVRDLGPQVDEMLLVFNGTDPGEPPVLDRTVGVPARLLHFEHNRGTAAAWNAAVSMAEAGGYRYLFILDQDSVPAPNAVARAAEQIAAPGVAAVVQPARRRRFGPLPFPWNTVASGSLYEVDALKRVGGFDERLFVDEVDHELLSRLIADGYKVEVLAQPTIVHQAGSPRPVRLLGRQAWVSGHSPQRHRLRGFSTGLLVRRYARPAPALSAQLLAREAITAGKELVAGERESVKQLAIGLARGVATARPPQRATSRACPYCRGVLLGRFEAVPDWIFATGPEADVFVCASCGALVAGRLPGPDEAASWYSDYYTHDVEPARSRLWSSLWPTPRRRQELGRLRSFMAPAGSRGRFLEVGTGSGERLVEFARAGWDVVGQDLDPKAGEQARDRGITVHTCSVVDLEGREAPFDLIGLSHVVEHALDPAEVIGACVALLAPGGRLCVISPNPAGLGRRLFGRWWYGLDQPRHLAVPTLESLRRVGAELDLRVVEARSVSANAAVFLGGSLVRPFEARLPPGRARRAARFATAFVGQGIGRVAVLLDDRLGEEIVWVGQRPSA